MLTSVILEQYVLQKWNILFCGYYIEWDDGWNTDFFTLPVIGFASTNLNFKSVFVRFVRVVRIPSPRFINFHLSSGGMIADNHFK